jgi:hypothetical protein
VMCDVPMLAALTWAAAWWVRGVDERRAGLLALAAVAMALAVLTKYNAAVFLPALALYAWLRRGPGAWLAWFLVPAAALLGYGAFALAAYGTAGTAFALSSDWAGRPLGQLLVGLCFLGATFLPLALSAGLSARPRVFGIGLLAAAIGALGLGASLVRPRDASTWILPAHYGVFAVVGLGLFYLVAVDAARRREPASALLAAWVVPGLVFATWLSWSDSVRYVLPLGPALAVLVARLADDHPSRGVRFPALVAAVLAVSAAIALVVTQGDTALGNSARTAAAQVSARSRGAHVVFQGHWGFQYYLQLAGGAPLEQRGRALEHGDLLVTPANAPNTLGLKSEVQRAAVLELPVRAWAVTMSKTREVGLHSSAFGVMPYLLGRPAGERYDLMLMTTPVDIPRED